MGHSMGGMAAMKLAAAQPSRIISLTVISSTGGGWEAIPSTWRAIRYAWMARSSPPAATLFGHTTVVPETSANATSCIGSAENLADLLHCHQTQLMV